MKGTEAPQGAAERARKLRAQGWTLQQIADEFGLSDAWASKETKGVRPGQRSRYRHLNEIDVASTIQGFSARGFTDAQIAAELKVSASFAQFLRRKHVGLSAASVVDRQQIVDLLRAGKSSTAIADQFGVSTSFVNNLRRETGVEAPILRPHGPRARRPMIGMLGYVRDHFEYAPETGEFKRRGQGVGFLRHGYIFIAVRNRTVCAHRLAWLIYYGEEPPAVIDHQDGDPTNNRIANLRAATTAQNAFNKRRASNNSTGVKGVSLTSNGRYRVRVQAGAKSADCEVNSLNEAREARQRLANLLHGEFARHA